MQAGSSPAAAWLCGGRREGEQRVEDLRELAERRIGEGAGRVQDAGDAAQQVAEQVARALNGVDPQLDLVGAHDEPEKIQVDRAEVEAEDRAGVAGRKRWKRKRRDLAGLGLRGSAGVGDGRRDADALLGDLLVAELAFDGADGVDLAALGDEALDRVGAAELLVALGALATDRNDLREPRRPVLSTGKTGPADEHETAREHGRGGGQANPGHGSPPLRGLTDVQ